MKFSDVALPPVPKFPLGLQSAGVQNMAMRWADIELDEEDDLVNSASDLGSLEK